MEYSHANQDCFAKLINMADKLWQPYILFLHPKYENSQNMNLSPIMSIQILDKATYVFPEKLFRLKDLCPDRIFVRGNQGNRIKIIIKLNK